MPTKKSPGKIKKFTVHRSKWTRGGNGDAALLTHSGQKCCLGFLATTCGFKPDEMREMGDLDILTINDEPDDKPCADRLLECVPRLVRPDPRYGAVANKLHDQIVRTNDDPMEPAEREKRLKKLFAKAGITVVFK